MGIVSGKTYDPAAGRESRSAFIAQAAFWLAAGKFLLNGVTVKPWREFSVNFGTVDAALLAAFLLPCLALYWGRRSFTFGHRDLPITPGDLNSIQGGSVG
jgi:hypothetical protein